MNANWSCSPETSNLCQNRQFCPPAVTLKFWQMTLKNNRAPLLTYFKLCASFRSHWWSNWSYSPETPNLGQNRGFFVPCDLEIWQMTLKKKIGQPFFATSSYVHHFVAICEFKLELWSGNAQIGSKFNLTSLTLTFWPWSFRIDITSVNVNNS